LASKLWQSCKGFFYDETVLWALSNLAFINLYQANFRIASEFCRKINEDCNRTGNIYLLHTYNVLLGLILSLQGSFQEAIELLEYTSRQVAEQFPQNQDESERRIIPI
jgi:hypothetical protein